MYVSIPAWNLEKCVLTDSCAYIYIYTYDLHFYSLKYKTYFALSCCFECMT